MVKDDRDRLFPELRGAVYSSLLGRYASYVVQILSMMLLARWFIPEHFGVVALFTVFALFFSLIGQFGMVAALINETDCSSEKRDAAFTLTCVTALALSCLFYTLFQILSVWMAFAHLDSIALLFSVFIFLSVVSTVPSAALNKDRKFIRISTVDIFSESFAILCLFVALDYENALFVLAGKSVLVSAARFLGYMVLARTTSLGVPRLGWSLKELGDLLPFAKYEVSFNAVNFVAGHIDNVLVGKFFGLSVLAFYEKSFALMRYPMLLIAQSMSPAIQPVFSKNRQNVNQIGRVHVSLLRHVGNIGAVIGAIFFVCSQELVAVALGDQWGEVAPLLTLFAFGVPFRIVNGCSRGFYQALGRSKLSFYVGLRSAFVNLVAIAIGILASSLDVMVVCLVLSYFVNMLWNFRVMNSKLYFGSVNFFSAIASYGMVFLGALTAGLLSKNMMPDLSPLFGLFSYSALSAAGGIFVLFFNGDLSPLFRAIVGRNPRL